MNQHRKPLIAGNWKMHGTGVSTANLLSQLKQGSIAVTHTELVVFPPYVFLEQTQRALADTSIGWGAQNMSEQAQGAFTGEISGGMLVDLGCRYVLVGHSERRLLYGENDHTVAAKYTTARQAGLYPVICVGETLQERQAGITHQIITAQLGALFASAASVEGLQQSVIAYEPVWAIGTGLTASPDLAQAVHQLIRDTVAEYDKAIALNLRILYGGSVKRDNAAGLLAMPDIDGALIGGASLNATEFLDIAKLCNN